MKISTIIFICFLNFTCNLLGQGKGVWIIVDSLNVRRMNHAGVQLENGNVLVTGGYTPTNDNGTSSTEIFDINTMKWNISSPMNKERAYHDLIRLKDGSVLAIGGFIESTCEVLNNNKWTFTDSIKVKRYYGQSTVLMNDGNVLLTGGYMYFSYKDSNVALTDCEIYNYKEGNWEITTGLNTGRFDQTATLLMDGRILVTGGKIIKNGQKLINTCEIFDPKNLRWSFTAPMHYERAGHSATLLKDGRVLIVGGQQGIPEIYDPLKDEWIEEGQVFLAVGHNIAFTISNEKYLLLIHDINGNISNPGWELYSLENFESVYYENFKRIVWDQVILKINEQRILIAGGTEGILAEPPAIVPTQFCQMYDVNLTGIREKNHAKDLKDDFIISCFPNPFNSITNISWKMNTSGLFSIELYNSLGEKMNIIYEGMLNEGIHEFKFNMNGYSCGVYLIKAIFKNKMRVTKIIYLK